jgi:rare lipoprotein A
MLRILVILGLFISACAKGTPSYAHNIKTVKYGQAVWYGPKYHNKKTASGEIFDMYALTAAHRSLPFGTKVKVTNLKNGKSVIVTINDRGPFGKKERIIDLSYGAALKLDMIKNGVVPVKIEILK